MQFKVSKNPALYFPNYKITKDDLKPDIWNGTSYMGE